MRLLGNLMSILGTAAPRPVELLLAWPGTWLIARLLLVSDFVAGGLEKLANVPGAMVEMQNFGLHPGWLWAGLAIVAELVGSTLIILGRYVWVAAGGLGILTGVAALVAHHFWTLRGKAEMAGLNGFLEDLGLIAGFVLAASLSTVKPARCSTSDPQPKPEGPPCANA